MLNSIKAFFIARFEQAANQNKSDQELEHLIQLATASLLIEISRSDSTMQTEELDLIQKRIETMFEISPEEARELFLKANDKVEDSVSLYEFTRVLNDNLSREERVHIIELLWQVAFADSVLDKYEEYYVRKIADLLYVSQQDYIKAKHKALEANN